jgi:anti-sigma B factor antagonist
VAVPDEADAPHSYPVRITGALDWEASTAFVLRVARAVDSAVAQRADELAIDLSEVEYVDTAGLRALIEGKRHAGEAGLGFRLVRVPTRVLRVVEMAALSRFFGLPSVRSRRSGR